MTKKALLLAAALTGCGEEFVEEFVLEGASEIEHKVSQMRRYDELATDAKLCWWEGEYLSEIDLPDRWEEHIESLLEEIGESVDADSVTYKDPTGNEYIKRSGGLFFGISDVSVSRLFSPPAEPEIAICKSDRLCPGRTRRDSLYFPLSTPAPGMEDIARRAMNIHHYLKSMHEREQKAGIPICPETNSWGGLPHYLPYEPSLQLLAYEEFLSKAQDAAAEMEDIMGYPFVARIEDRFMPREYQRFKIIDGPFTIRARSDFITRDEIIHLTEDDDYQKRDALIKRDYVELGWLTMYVQKGKSKIEFAGGCIRSETTAPSYNAALEVAKRVNTLDRAYELLQEMGRRER